MVNFSRLTAEISWQVWGTSANFNGLPRLGFVTAPTSLSRGQPNFAGCLAVSWDGTPHIFLGALAPNRILQGVSKSCITALLAALLHGT